MGEGRSHVIKTCPECFRTYPDEVRFCGLDGIPLVEKTISQIAAGPDGGDSSYLGTLVDGRYRIKQLIGRGGMGSVFEVEHIHMRKRLAMKMLHEDMVVRKQLVSRFTREARAVSRLSNEHTVRVYDFGRHKALFFLVMEFLDGVDLEVVLSREGALPWERALKVLDQVCESLEEAHAAGIIHRDLKPENIMVLRAEDGSDHIKVLDFGLAKITEGADDVFTVHSQRDLFGTPFYMSPEQIRSEEIDPRADVYALGCLLYRTLVNQHVYDAPYAFDVLRKQLSAPIPSAARDNPRGRIPARVDRMMWRALAKRKEDRFPDVAALRREVQATLRDPQGYSAAVPLDYRPRATAKEAIDPDLEARLSAFEQSHQAADARMHGEAPPSVPPEDPGGLTDPEMPLPTRSSTSEGKRKGGHIRAIQVHTERDEDAIATLEDLRVPSTVRALLDPPPIEPVRPEPEPPPAPIVVAPVIDRAADPVPTDVVATIASPATDTMGLTTSDHDFSSPEDEDDSFARRLRRRRLIARGLMAAAVSAMVVAGGILWMDREAESRAYAEVEPNDHPAQATPITPGVGVSGALGAALAEFEGDRDTYRVEMGGPGRFLALDLTPIPDVDLALRVMDGAGRTLARVDYDGVGARETIHRLRVADNEAVVVVSEARKGDDPPTENPADGYVLTATVATTLDDGEVEPNDAPPSANAYRAGTPVTGYLDGPRDVDYYRVETDGVMDLRRWEIDVEAAGGMIPRISLYRMIERHPLLVYADEGHEASLRTVYEEPRFPQRAYVVAVEHSGRGDARGAYTLVADLLPAKPAIAHEPNDDRARAVHVAIGQQVRGTLEGPSDTDVFAIPVRDPRHRVVQVEMDPVVRARVRLRLTDQHEANMAEFPPRRSAHAPPQPRGDELPPRFEGAGETYYLTVRGRGRHDRDQAYSFRVLRVMDDAPTGPAVGGPR